MGSGELERGIWGVENQSEGYGKWRTRARDMGSGELERGIWGVENQSEGYGEWRTRERDMGSGDWWCRR